MKKDVFYFPHYCHSRSDRRIRRILKDFKHEGFSVYYQILEVLREQEEFKYSLEDCDLLVDDLKTTDIVVNSLIMNYDLFQNDGVYFWSDDLIESLQPYLKMKQQRIEASKKGVEARRKKREQQKALEQPTGNRPVTDRLTEEQPTGLPTADQSKVKESKVKETKVNKSKDSLEEDFEYLFFNESFKETFYDFLEVRKGLKARNTEKAKKLLLGKIEKLSRGNIQLAIQLVEQSIENSWKGIFEIKNNDNQNFVNNGKSNSTNKGDQLIDALKDW